MEYTRSKLLTGSAVANELATIKYQREQRKAIQFAEAENLVEQFLVNRLDPKFPKRSGIDSNHIMHGEIPPQYFLDTLGKLKTFQTDPLGEQQAIHRVLVALVKANILEIRSKGPGTRKRVFRIVGSAHFCKSNGEQAGEMKIVNLGG